MMAINHDGHNHDGHKVDGHSNENVKSYRRTFKKSPNSQRIHGLTIFQKTWLWPSWSLWPSWFVAVIVLHQNVY